VRWVVSLCAENYVTCLRSHSYQRPTKMGTLCEAHVICCCLSLRHTCHPCLLSLLSPWGLCSPSSMDILRLLFQMTTNWVGSNKRNLFSHIVGGKKSKLRVSAGPPSLRLW
jgi:hypothetical protein